MSSIYAVNGQNQKPVTLNYHEVKLSQVLHEISNNYGLDFSYRKDHLPADLLVTIQLTNASMENALSQLFENSHLQFQIIGDQVALKKNVQEPADSLKTHPSHAAGILRQAPVNSLAKMENISPKNSKSAETEPFNNYHFSTSITPKYLNKKILKSRATRLMQATIVPGIGTNGLDGGGYNNWISLNIFSGYSAGTYLFELGGLSNLNTDQASGFQFAGIANVVGGDAMLKLSKEDYNKIAKEGYNYNMQGWQTAGLINVVRGNMIGWQVSGVENLVFNSYTGLQVGGIVNIVHNFTTGVQLAGLGNVTGRSVTGVQLAGFSNFSTKQMAGIQIAALSNYTRGRLNGTQIGAFNYSGNIEGKFSKLSSKYSGLQIGAVNLTRRNMDGFQVGLVNISNDMNGLQVGLINISTRNQRFPVGLVNINHDEYGYFRLYTNETFNYNVEVATGSKHIINTISYSRNPNNLVVTGQPRSAFGYAIGQIKSRQNYFYNYDLQIQHINQDKGITKELSLLGKLRGAVGFDPFYRTKLRDIFFFGGITFNTYLSRHDTPIGSETLQISHKKSGNKYLESWVGFMVGVNVDFH